MKIKKYGHCCLLVGIEGVRILTDPGSYSEGYAELENLDLVLISHEHADHLHMDGLKQVLKHNPEVKIGANQAVGKLLEAEGIDFHPLGDGQQMTVKGLLIEGMGSIHAEIYKTVPSVENTGFFIANYLFYPGDALYQPSKAVEVLALPVAGPWLKISEAIDYALAVKPRVCFPVHDGVLRNPGMMSRPLTMILEAAGVRFQELATGQTAEF